MPELIIPEGLEWMKPSFDAEYMRQVALEQEFANLTPVRLRELREILLSLDWITDDEKVEGTWVQVEHRGPGRVEFTWIRDPIRVALILGYGNSHYGQNTCVIDLSVVKNGKDKSWEFRLERSENYGKVNNRSHALIAQFVLKTLEEFNTRQPEGEYDVQNET